MECTSVGEHCVKGGSADLIQKEVGEGRGQAAIFKPSHNRKKGKRKLCPATEAKGSGDKKERSERIRIRIPRAKNGPQ